MKEVVYDVFHVFSLALAPLFKLGFRGAHLAHLPWWRHIRKNYNFWEFVAFFRPESHTKNLTTYENSGLSPYAGKVPSCPFYLTETKNVLKDRMKHRHQTGSFQPPPLRDRKKISRWSINSSSSSFFFRFLFFHKPAKNPCIHQALSNHHLASQDSPTLEWY